MNVHIVNTYQYKHDKQVYAKSEEINFLHA